MLTKSDYLKGRQCPLRLWLSKHGAPEPQAESDDIWEDREAEGAEVERLAESMFDQPIRIDQPIDDDQPFPAAWDPADAAERTAAAMRGSGAVFQACFRTRDLLTVIDIAAPDGAGWRLIEVKASTKLVPLNDWDLAFQWEVAQRSGVAVTGVSVCRLDPDYVRGPGPVEAAELLQFEDRTSQVEALRGEARAELEQMLAMLTGGAPDEHPGTRCKASRAVKAGNRPSTCGHFGPDGQCGCSLPAHWAGRLPKLGGRKAELVAEQPGLSLLQLDPEDASWKWTPSQARMIRAAQAGQPEIDRGALTAKLAEIRYPATYIDFEFDPGMAVPRFEGMKPYTRIPFQWSMHVQDEPGGELRAPPAFLWLESTDPRRAFIESLLEAMPAEGSVIVHSKAAEQTVLKDLAASYGGEIADRIESVVSRLYDTIDLLQAGYYHPDQQGSYSIKKVAPALLGTGYQGLDIQDGMAAVVAWRRACDPMLELAAREPIRASLLQYCGRDTELMHQIVEKLRAIATK